MKESDWLNKAAALFGTQHPGVPVGIGDDCAVLEPRGLTLVSTDTVVAGVHLDQAVMTHEDMGWRALAVALSDLAACGADPTQPITAFISTQLPAEMQEKEILDFAQGMNSCAEKFGCAIGGGDTVSTPGPFAVSITVVGYTARAILRKGARVGDLVAVTGPLGEAAAGLLVLRRQSACEDHKACIDAFLRPIPLLAVGFKLAQSATAMIDISDGAVVDLDNICRASRVGAKLHLEELPVSQGASDLFQQAGYDPAETAATFGDDYQLLCCLHPNDLEPKKVEVPGLTVVGQIVEGQKAMVLREGRPVDLKQRGYEHGLPTFTFAKEDR